MRVALVHDYLNQMGGAERVLLALHALYPAQWETKELVLLVGSHKVVDEIMAGEDPRRIQQDWMDDLQKFVDARKKYLIY